jgi:hypothetical protein
MDKATRAGMEDVEITETHRVHDCCARSAIIRARKPS